MNTTERLGLKKPIESEKYDINIFNDNMDIIDNSYNYNSLPIGAVICYAGSSALDGFLECDGRAVSRTTWASLFAKIGTTYGAGDGSTTFNLPDYSNRVPIGVSSSIDLGAKGGASTHVHALDDNGFAKISTIGGMGSGVYGIYKSINTISGGTKIAGSASDSEVSYGTPLGGKTAIGNNMQPYIGQRYLIKALNQTEEGNFLMSVSNNTPIGSISEYAGENAPENYLLCDGSEVSRTEYAELFAVIGTSFGSGNGSTTFKIPDLRKRFPMGKDASSLVYGGLGVTGGSTTHNHEYGIQAGGYFSVTGLIEQKNAGILNYDSSNATSIASFSNIGYKTMSLNTSVTQSNNDVNAVFYESKANTSTTNTLPPYIVVNFIIKAKNPDNVLTTFAQVENSLDSNSQKNAPSIALLKSLLTPTILWSNSNPTGAFARQTITLSEKISNFTCYEVLYKSKNTSDQLISTGKIPIAYATKMQNINGAASSDLLTTRSTTVPSGTSITFNDCYSGITNTTSVTTNFCIPILIRGYRI